jgi:hypothetical protein
MEQMTLRCPVTIKSKVTESLKEKIIAELDEHMEMADRELQNLEFQAKRMMSEQAKMDAQGLISLRAQVEQEKQKLLNIKAQTAAKLKDAEKLEIGSEISQGTMEQTIVVKIGDDLSVLMGAEILLEDGKVIAFRQ